ncbi:MAG: LamG-like jellyroll fold domain-containing protein, partial [Draconibacterium sp.]
MKKNLLLKFWTFLMLTCIFGSTAAFGQATLKHSYTFETGTYDETTVFDQAGTVDGTLGGTKITIADGKATVSGATVNSDGWISLDGVALALNTYSAVTLEAFVETGVTLNSSFTMLAYFGTATPGNRCFWIQPTRSGSETRIEANNGTTTVTALKGSYEVDDGKKHHIVAVLNSEAITYYLDGVILASTPTGADYVSTLGTDVANLFRGVDGWNDPNYNASLLEFNIYDGTVAQNVIAQTAGEFLGLDLTNANLVNLATNVGTLEPEFSTEEDIYEVTVPYGTTALTLSATPEVGGVTVKMFDGLGNELQNGVVTFDKDDGIDIEVEITALDAFTKKSYYVSVFPEAGESSATLGSINLSAGALTTGFSMDDTAYVAIVPAGTATVDVTGVANWDGATVTGNGTVTLADGMGTATLTVTSEDASATKVYTVNIYTSVFAVGTDFYLVHETNGFVAAESGSAFNQVVLADAIWDSGAQLWQFEDSGVEGQYYIKNKDGNYMCLSRTSANAWDLEVYPDLPSVGLDSARFIINEFEPGRYRIISVRKQQVSATNNILGPNNANLASPLFNDKPASNALTVFNIKFPAEVASPYDIHLSSLAITGVSLKPAFDPAIKKYYATIPAGMNSVVVTATPRDAGAVVTGAGSVDVSAGNGTITVTVTASDPQYTRMYEISYVSDTELTLMHSYTFDDGTANDQVGGANGTVHGGTFADETFIAEKEGDYIILPADEIAINTYPSFTMEMHVTTGANPGWTMYNYFGNASGGDHTFFISIAGNNNQARAVLNLGDGEVQAASTEPGSGETHHYVSVVTNDSIFWYVDGSLAQKTANKASYLIKDIAATHAWFGYGAYNDPTWLGTTNEYNIYSGQMDAATVAERAIHFLGGIPDATLASLTVDAGELIPAFDPAVTTYSVVIPSGTTTINVTAVTNSDKSTVEGAGAVDVSSGSGSAAVVVTAENGATKIYNIEFSTPSEYTLMHSYTFDDGTAVDVVGEADGTLMGAGTIANGAYTAAANGDYIELPAADIAINTYAAITLEGYIYSDVDNTGSTMMTYFGGNENDLGGNGYFFTPDRNAESRTAISCGNITAPWTAEQGVTGPAVSVGEKHHVVSVLTDSSIKWYIDGILIGDAEVSGANSIAGLSNANAWLCKGGYTADPTWMGTIDEFNIYNGVLDAATIAEHAEQYLGGGGLTLMHSYTFEDGTANDVVGTAHGVLEGDAAVAGGMLTLSGTGFVTLPAADIDLSAYSSVTFEGVFKQAEGLDGFTAFASFGDVNPTTDWMGINYIILQPTRNDNEESRTSISCLNTTDPWATENGVNGAEINDTLTHHWVTVINATDIKLYIDGVLIGTAPLTGNNALANVGKTVALIGKDVYPGDPLWQGSMDELNIYEGEMDSATIAERAQEYLSVLTLMHSYTFEDGTANDVVGTAHGVLEGDAAVAGGMLTLSGTGFVTLPAADIDLSAYSSVTFEGVFKQAEGLDGFTAFASFGDVNPTTDWMGINYIILQPTRNDNEESRSSISCLNTTDPWATENGVNGAEINDTKTHHW